MVLMEREFLTDGRLSIRLSPTQNQRQQEEEEEEEEELLDRHEMSTAMDTFNQLHNFHDRPCARERKSKGVCVCDVMW